MKSLFLIQRLLLQIWLTVALEHRIVSRAHQRQHDSHRQLYLIILFIYQLVTSIALTFTQTERSKLIDYLSFSDGLQ